MDEKILALCSCGMSQRDIAEQVKSLYDVEISTELVTKISEKIMPEVTARQNQSLKIVYLFVPIRLTQQGTRCSNSPCKTRKRVHLSSLYD